MHCANKFHSLQLSIIELHQVLLWSPFQEQEVTQIQSRCWPDLYVCLSETGKTRKSLCLI